MLEDRCSVCGSDEVVEAGPLTVSGKRAQVTDMIGKQCLLCGNLQLSVPQALLVRLYPPEISHLTFTHRQQAQWRRKTRKRLRG